jgi:hypothetical protein
MNSKILARSIGPSWYSAEEIRRKNEGGGMVSRRSFCGSAMSLFGLAVIGSGCVPRKKVLKYPESAEECADLFEFFTDPAFGFDQAKAGLHITGEPKILDATSDWRRTTFPSQNGLIRSIELGTSKGELSSIHIYYQSAIDVSLKRLESLLGTSKEYNNVTVGGIDRSSVSPTAAFTNIMPDSPQRNRPRESSYGFYPEEPLKTGLLKGSLLINCESTDKNVKRTSFLRYERWTNSK